MRMNKRNKGGNETELTLTRAGSTVEAEFGIAGSADDVTVIPFLLKAHGAAPATCSCAGSIGRTFGNRLAFRITFTRYWHCIISHTGSSLHGL